MMSSAAPHSAASTIRLAARVPSHADHRDRPSDGEPNKFLAMPTLEPGVEGTSRPHKARAYRRDVDFISCKLGPKRVGQACKREFACTIRGKMRNAYSAANGRNVDDPASAPPHQRERRAHGMEGSPEMNCQRLFEVLLSQMLERTHLDDSRVVDQKVNRAGAFGDTVDQALCVVTSRDITHDCGNIDSTVAEVLSRPLEFGFVSCGDSYPLHRGGQARERSTSQARASPR